MTVTRTTPIGDLPELLRVDEVAAWLGISRGVAYELARDPEAHVRLGRLVRVKRSWLARQVGRDA